MGKDTIKKNIKNTPSKKAVSSNSGKKPVNKKKRVHPARSKKKSKKNKEVLMKQGSDCPDLTDSGSDDSSVTSNDTNASLQSDVKPSKAKKARKSNSPNKKKKSNAKKNLSKKAPVVLGCMTEEQSRYLAMDCEMVGVGAGGIESALGRVSIVNYYGHVVLDTYVKVPERVTDFRTKVSGITARHISSKDAIDIETCRDIVKDILKEKVLVGHGLKNDLKALGLSHPWYNIRDTKYEPYLKEVDGVTMPRRLKELALTRLRKEIQKDGKCHCPIEDSRIAMELYIASSVKWERAMEYKIMKTREFEEQSQLVS